jgi:ELWxxDGT repeat protein
VPGATGSYPTHLTAVGNRLIFAAADDEHLHEPWISDGTAAGTMLIKDINTNTGPSNYTAPFFTPVNGTTIFFAYDGIHGMELWRTDGTADGTVLVKDIRPGREWGVDPSYGPPAVLNGFAYFAADDGVKWNRIVAHRWNRGRDHHGRQLWHRHVRRVEAA